MRLQRPAPPARDACVYQTMSASARQLSLAGFVWPGVIASTPSTRPTCILVSDTPGPAEGTSQPAPSTFTPLASSSGLGFPVNSVCGAHHLMVAGLSEPGLGGSG